MSLSTENKNKIEHIASELLYHKKLYYSGKSVISDAVYDALENDLRKLSPNHPVLSLVGYKFEHTGKKISRKTAMLSLAKTYSIEELYEFLGKHSCVVMDKIDGMALSVEYNSNGSFLRASTRGNGKLGEDVSEHVYHIKNIPKKLNIDAAFDKLKFEIRGEVYFPLNEFKNFAERFDSFRNAVPGTLGRKEVDEAVDVLRVLNFCVYDFLIYDNDGELVKASDLKNILNISPMYLEKMYLLKKLGFTDNFDHMQEFLLPKDSAELGKYLDNWYLKERNYSIDGLVFRINDEVIWENLGNTSHHPRGSLAFKKAGETAETEILDIEENIGRSGKITFRAKLKTVDLSGAKISYATLHNAEFIEHGKYSIGAKVEIIRSGEVIPAIVRLIEPSDKPFQLPTKCKCGFPLIRQGPDLMCLEKRSCNFKDQESLVYFVSSLDINGVSDKIVLKIREAGLVQEPADFFKLTVDDLLQIEGFAKKSSENVIAAIKNSKNIPLAKFLTSLGLKRGGAVKCQEVARKCGNLQNVLQISVEDLMQEKGWAQKSAEDFIQSLHDKKIIIKNLLEFVTVLDDDSGLKIKTQNQHPYFGKNICITGSLSRPRDEYKKMLDNIGAKLVTSVSSKTDFLVCNEASSSSKYKDALKYNVTIINESEFAEKL
jgi:DNA ligase (NAD+)